MPIGMPGLPELIIIAFILVVLFGARKVPQLMKGVGEGIKELRNSLSGRDDDE